MVLKQGEKLHLIIRRNFNEDLRRHFVGEVIEVDETMARVEGFIFVLNTGTNQYNRRLDKRTRIIGLADSGNIINILPEEAKLEDVRYIQSAEQRLVVTDGSTFSLDINEFGSAH